MARIGRYASVLALVACAAPAQERAPMHQTVISRSQTMTPPAVPFACDLDVVPVGSWADYQEKNPLLRDPITKRYALVGRGLEGNTVEWTFDVSARTPLVTAFVFSSTQARLIKLTSQDGEFDPMDRPLPLPQTQNFYGRIDQRWFVRTEEIAVAAGTFSAKRYHYLTPYGENVDAWLSDTAWPICLVKLEAEQKQAEPQAKRLVYELVAMGGGATPRIATPAVPYDLEVLKKQDEQKRIRGRRPDNGPRVGDTIAP